MKPQLTLNQVRIGMKVKVDCLFFDGEGGEDWICEVLREAEPEYDPRYPGWNINDACFVLRAPNGQEQIICADHFEIA